MDWPQNLVACTLLRTLHAEDDSETNGLSWYCVMASVASFFFFLPGHIFAALRVFSWISWIAPNNVPLNWLFGAYTVQRLGNECVDV